MNDKLSRVAQLDFAGTSGAAAYKYLGLGGVVVADYTEPDVMYTLVSGGGTARYGGLDAFDRVVDLQWKQSTTDLARWKYGYDLASNRTYRRDEVARAQTTPKPFDEIYTQDGLHRLQSAARGFLNDANGQPANTSIPTSSFGQTWDLDSTGNWSRFQEYNDQGSQFSVLDQTRAANSANEITEIAATAGPKWAQPAYDRNGNMTQFPKPATLRSPYAAEYDA